MPPSARSSSPRKPSRARRRASCPTPFRSTDFPGQRYTLQVAPEDCTGCSLCVQVCPAKDNTNPRHKAIDMVSQPPRLAAERANWDFFLKLPDPDRARLDPTTVKGSQFMTPLFEFSGACAGCGETPYLKLLTPAGRRPPPDRQRDRLLLDLRRQPADHPLLLRQADGRGPTWANSLFEDNAEFGLGLHLAVEQRSKSAREILARLSDRVGSELAGALAGADQTTEAGIAAQRARVATLKTLLGAFDRPGCQAPDGPRRRAGEEIGLDPGRRRMGLRHRLRRPRPRARLGSKRQDPGPRHGGLLEHRRPGLQVDAHGRRGQVRRQAERAWPRRTWR